MTKLKQKTKIEHLYTLVKGRTSLNKKYICLKFIQAFNANYKNNFSIFKKEKS